MTIKLGLYILGGLLTLYSLWWVCDSFHAKQTLRAVEAAVKREKEIARKDLDIALENARAETKIKTEIRFIEKEVIKYVTESGNDPVCIDDHLRGLWNQANRGQAPNNP